MDIESYAFYGCIGLTEIRIPESVMNIGSYAFYNTAWFNNQPDGVVYAGKVAYKYKGTMPSNTKINILEGTKSISEGAFSGCTGLTEITIPESVTIIETGAFDDTAWYNNQPDGVVYAGKVLYSYKGTMPSDTKIDILEGIKSISSYAFAGCTGLTEITIPNSVTRIGDAAFRGCTGLTEVAIPNRVISLGSSAFSGCTDLTEVIIPDSVTTIGEYAFYGCKELTEIKIPESITSIGSDAFYGWTESQTINIEANEVPGGWHEDWDYKCNAKIVFGYTGE